jgi:hypothetical protein
LREKKEGGLFIMPNIQDSGAPEGDSRRLSNWERHYLRMMKQQATERGDQKEVQRLSKMYGNWGI